MRTASLHLVRHPRRRVPALLVRYLTDRRHLRATPGLEFWRVLGTGRGPTMTTSADLRRWAVFAVWEDDAALDRFLERSPLARWWAGAEEAWHVRLTATHGHGSWAGTPVADLLLIGTPTAAQPDARTAGGGGPVAVLTRATVRARRLLPFHRATGPVDAVLRSQPGLLAAVGVGEAPVGRQATFSVWQDDAALTDFAYRDPTHAEVVRRTRDESWYGEELFVRFSPYHSAGTWDGADPLGAVTVAGPDDDGT